MSRKTNQETGTNSDRTFSRRAALRAGALATGAALIPTTLAAGSQRITNSERADRHHANALRIREKSGSQEKFEQYLRRHADHVLKRSFSFTPASVQQAQQEDGNVSTESWGDSHISTDLTLSYYTDCSSGDPFGFVDYNVTVSPGTISGEGEAGPDQIAVSWDGNHYRYEQGSAYHNTNMSNLSLKEQSIYGCDWEWKDGASCPGGFCGEKNPWVGCKVQLLDTYQERAVQASYYDMYNNATVETVTIGTDGTVSFTFSKSGDSDQHGFQIREDSDAVDSCPLSAEQTGSTVAPTRPSRSTRQIKSCHL